MCFSLFSLHLQVLEYEQQYLAALPLPEMYEKSYMHRDTGKFCIFKITLDMIATSAGNERKFYMHQGTDRFSFC